ncbi:MAG: pyruvate kinase [Patescibacteria group bacterium]|nr:pyruvate kinase [Patescibacteria group bacterium]
MIQKRTKVVCTLGPASEDKKTIERMVKAGMNVARLNFSHGTYENFKMIIKNVREVSKKLGKPVAILQDLQGLKIRVGKMPKNGLPVKNGDRLTITTREVEGKKGLVPSQYKNLAKDVHKGDIIFIEDGLIELKVLSKQGENIKCRVVEGGIIKSNKGINVPTATITANPMTAKDKKDLEFGIKHDVDWVALSFVMSEKDVLHLRKLIQAKKSKARIIAKIERQEAVQNMRKIIKAADGVMVARGDLGIEISPEMVPIIQKKIIKLANRYGKPVITATQMLQSMVEKPIATRAEISDAANAVFDNTDALMLSNESAVGKYPVDATETLSKVARTVEHELSKNEDLKPITIKEHDIPIANATCLNAAKLARDIDAHYIVAVTGSGFTAQHIVKHRLYTPVITITNSEKVRNQLALVWGLNEIHVHEISLKNITSDIKTFIREKKLVKKGSEVVIVCNASKKHKLISTVIA